MHTPTASAASRVKELLGADRNDFHESGRSGMYNRPLAGSSSFRAAPPELVTTPTTSAASSSQLAFPSAALRSTVQSQPVEMYHAFVQFEEEKEQELTRVRARVKELTYRVGDLERELRDVHHTVQMEAAVSLCSRREARQRLQTMAWSLWKAAFAKRREADARRQLRQANQIMTAAVTALQGGKVDWAALHGGNSSGIQLAMQWREEDARERAASMKKVVQAEVRAAECRLDLLKLLGKNGASLLTDGQQGMQEMQRCLEAYEAVASARLGLVDRSLRGHARVEETLLVLQQYLQQQQQTAAHRHDEAAGGFVRPAPVESALPTVRPQPTTTTTTTLMSKVALYDVQKDCRDLFVTVSVVAPLLAALRSDAGAVGCRLLDRVEEHLLRSPLSQSVGPSLGHCGGPTKKTLSLHSVLQLDGPHGWSEEEPPTHNDPTSFRVLHRPPNLLSADGTAWSHHHPDDDVLMVRQPPHVAATTPKHHSTGVTTTSAVSTLVASLKRRHEQQQDDEEAMRMGSEGVSRSNRQWML